MNLFADIAVGLVALLHLEFLVLEMFLWTRPLGLKVFGLSAEQAEATRVLAANQGLYNGFIAAGLTWGMWLGEAGKDIKLFFLICVIVAGLYGAWSASRKILWFQAVPGIVALILVLVT